MYLKIKPEPLKIQYLNKALKECEPINNKLLMRLYNRIGFSQN